MNIKTLIAECIAYDFRAMLEEKKPKRWLNSISSLANGIDGSLFFGVEYDDTVRGLNNVQHVCETINSKICVFMDPLPEFVMMPEVIDGCTISQLKVNAGNYTPYYFVGDGQRVTLGGHKDELKPVFRSSPTQYQTIIFASSDTTKVGNHVGDETL